MMGIKSAIAKANLMITDKFGIEYIRKKYKDACTAYTEMDSNTNASIEYFLGLEGDSKINQWIVYARTSIDLETEEVIFLDYRLPDGTRMEKPIKPVKYA